MSVRSALGTHLYRRIRYLGLTEFLWTWLKSDPHICLPNGVQIDVKPEDILIDCGANIGDVTSAFARTGGKVYAFEPHPDCFRILRRRFSMMRKVYIFNQGVMDRACTLVLSTPNTELGFDDIDTTVAASFIPSVVNAANSRSKYTVECIDLDDFIRHLGARVRLLKLDIEGSEIGVLNRLLDSRTINLIDLVVVETHERFDPDLLAATNALRERVDAMELAEKIRLDWD